MTVVDWTLKLRDMFSGPGMAAATAAKAIGDSARAAIGPVTKLGDALDKVAPPKVASGAGKFLGAGGGLGLPDIPDFNNALPDMLKPAKQLGVVQKAIQSIGKTFGPKASAAVINFADGIATLGEKLAPIAPLILPVAGAIAAGFGAAVLGAAKFGTAVIQAQAFREDLTRALETITKSKAAADAVLKKASETADFIGISRPQAVAAFADLLTKGFDVGKVDEIVKRLADLATVDPNASIERLTQLIGKIKAMGKINVDVITDLSTAGLEAGDVYAALAKTTGKSIAEVQKDLAAGKIDATAGVQAVLDAIKGQTGNLAAGAAANQKALNNLSSLIDRVKAIPENVLFDLDVGPGLDLVKGFLREILSLFDASSASGQRFRDVVGGAFVALMEGLFGDGPAAGGDKLKSTFDKVLDSIEANKGNIKQFGADMRTIAEAILAVTSAAAKLAEIKGGFDELLDSLGPVKDILKVLFFPLYLLANPIGAISDLISVFSALWDGISSAASGIWDALTSIATTIWDAAGELLDAALEIGSNIIDGIIDGITSGASGVIGAITGVAGDAIASAKAVLGIASPSKVFAEIGEFTSMGFERGIAANDGPATAMADMVAPPDMSGITAGGQALGAGIARGGGSPSVTVQVDARGATGADAQRIADMVAEAVTRSLESMALTVGAEAA